MDSKPVEDQAASAQKSSQEDISKADSDPNTLHVKVWSPFRVYFDGSATSISAVNLTGPFDILARHHNFITLVTACDLGLQTKDGLLKIRISGGVMHVRKNGVTVFLEV